MHAERLTTLALLELLRVRRAHLSRFDALLRVEFAVHVALELEEVLFLTCVLVVYLLAHSLGL